MANISIRMEDKLKQQAEELFSDLGMNLTCYHDFCKAVYT